MDCYIGASTGALKGAILRDNTFQNLNEIKGLDPKKDEITSMIWNDDLQTELLIARMNRELQLFNIEENEQVSLMTVDGGSGAIKGLHKNNERIITCVESGQVKVWNDKSETVAEWSTGSGVTIMRGTEESKQILTGGEQHLLKIWDIETGKNLWTAKNVAPDMLGLEIPIKITDARFIFGENTIIEATKLHEMRLYDPRTQRKPVNKIAFMENPIMTISLTNRQNFVLAATSIGEIGLFDIRSKVHPVCKFRGQSGSIRSIDAHPTSPIFASVGIDRFLRVHDIQTKKLVHKIYCKTRMNKVLMRNDLSILSKKCSKKEENVDESEYGNMTENGYLSDEEQLGQSDASDDDQLWDEMTTSSTTAESKKRKECGKSSLHSKKSRTSSVTLDDVIEVDESPEKSKNSVMKKRSGSKITKEVKEEDEDTEVSEAPKKKKKISKK